MRTPLAPSALLRLRFLLRTKLTGIPSSHIAEALAAGLGFGSAIALKAAERDARPGANADMSVDSFARRLQELGHEVSSTQADVAVTDACEGESVSPEWLRAHLVRLLADAFASDCSDVLVVDAGQQSHVETRRHGIISNNPVPHAVAAGLCSAAFQLGDGEATEDGEFSGTAITARSAALPDGLTLVRVQVGPLAYPSKPNRGARFLDARLFRAVSAQHSFNGFAPVQVAQIREMMRNRFGIMAFGGPAGSGKSTVIRGVIDEIKQKTTRLQAILIDDAPEYRVDGVAVAAPPSGVADATRTEKFRFNIMRSLKSDPDVIVVGDVRDKESMRLTFMAAMTGHLAVLGMSAINNAGSILDRFSDLGAEDYKLKDPTLIVGLVAQRLVRTLCPHCALDWSEAKRRGELDGEIVQNIEKIGGDLAAKVRVRNPKGCAKCEGRGYLGQEAIAEVIMPDRKFLSLWHERKWSEALAYWLAELNGLTMLEHAAAKMFSRRLDPRDVEDQAGELTDLDPARLPLALAAITEV